MSPTIVLGTDGKPLLVTGALGGSHFPTAFQVVSSALDYGFELGAGCGLRVSTTSICQTESFARRTVSPLS